jgi:hypothetical protein
MKTSLLRLPLVLGVAAFSLGALSLAGKDGARHPTLLAKLADRDVATEALAASPEAWSTIKDFTYEKRGDFTAVFARLQARLDDDIRILNAKRAMMTNDTKNWDFAMKELNNARADVQSKVTELSKAITPETWLEARDRLGVAWDRAQLATRNVKASTTS